MNAQEPVATSWRVARRFLLRWRDPYTRTHRDDIAQDAVVEAWKRRLTLRRPECHDAFVRTISRRVRLRAVQAAERCVCLSFDQDPELAETIVVEPPSRGFVRIGDRFVDKALVLDQIERVLAMLPPLNRALVLGFYEGFSCGELADRYGVGKHAVKTKLFRARRRIRRTFEGRVWRLESDGFSAVPTTERSKDRKRRTTKRSDS